MTFENGLFAHWPFEPEQLRPHVPRPLELDTFDGRAWVSLLPFVLSRAGLRFAPAFTRLTFPELNLRTYVEYDGEPGLYFFSLDVGYPVIPSLVEATTGLPCFYADMEVDVDGDSVDFRSVRRHPGEQPARFEGAYRPDGERYRADPGSLDYWLAERRRMYDPTGDNVLYADIAHGPWDLQPASATVRTNTIFEGRGLPTPDDEPRFRYSRECFMTGSVPRWIRADG